MTRLPFASFATLRRAALALGLLVALALAGAAQARPGRDAAGPGPFDAGKRLHRQLDRLDLAPATREAIDGVLESRRDAGRELGEQVRASQQALRALLEQDSPDSEEVMARVEKLGERTTEKRKHEIATLLEVRAQLTPEQRQQLAAMDAERRSHGFRKRHRTDDSAGAAAPQ